MSGGVDSVVMAQLFAKLDNKIALAHCNFQLRGEAADEDELAVKDLVEELGLPFYTTRFATADYAVAHKLSIQMAARELRYNWFGQLMQEHDLNLLATAHHKNDSVETILLNLVKGAVLSGLHGILPKNEHVIHPLLWAGKEEIAQYAREKGYNWRNDASNAENKYQRNLIRNEVIPLLRQINPDLENTMQHAADVRYEAESWFRQQAMFLWERHAAIRAGHKVITIKDVRSFINPAILLEWLQPFGFNSSQCQEICQSLLLTESRQWQAGAYVLVKDRDTLVIRARQEKPSEVVHATTGQASVICNGIRFAIGSQAVMEGIDFKDASIAWLDADKVKFPLTFRKWQAGDSFIPFGMRGRKKVSDYLTDIKAPALEKENQLVVLSGDNIIWLVGRRIDDRYRIGRHSRQLLSISQL